MGILNITPDSFYDGGKFFDCSKAIKHAKKIIEDGADIIDVGGESTRPGSDSISVTEEINRVIPVIKKLVKELDVPISIDTYKYEVAKEALKNGASLVNDITGLHEDKKIAELIADYKAGVVIMHIKGTPKDMQLNPVYDDLISEILEYLEEGIKKALEVGINRDSIAIDPGIGFGKQVEHNLKIIANLSKFKSLGFPLLIGTSRKSFIGKILDADVNDRLEGTLATIAISIANGANIIRVHDVKECKRVTMMVDGILRCKN